MGRVLKLKAVLASFGEVVIFESEFIKHHLSSRLQMNSGSHTRLQSLDNSHCISGVWVQAHLEYKFRMKEIHANTRHIIRHCQLFSSTYKTVSEKAMCFFKYMVEYGSDDKLVSLSSV